MRHHSSSPAPLRHALAFVAVALGAILVGALVFGALAAPSMAQTPECNAQGECTGRVEEILSQREYRVRINEAHSVIAIRAGKMRRYRIRLSVGDRVIVHIEPTDPNRGRITYRMR